MTVKQLFEALKPLYENAEHRNKIVVMTDSKHGPELVYKVDVNKAFVEVLPKT